MDSKISISQTRKAYSKGVDIYAGAEPGEDDPQWRSMCRQAFASRLQGREVLEVGCGPGTDAYYLSEMNLDVTATDFCEGFVNLVRKRYPHLKAEVFDITVPRQMGPFDGIYGHSCFLHIPRPLALPSITGLKGLLKPKGILFLSVIESTKLNEYTVPNWIGIENNPADFFCYSRKELTKIFEDAGFENIETLDLNWSPDSAYGQESTKKRIEDSGVSPYQIVGMARNTKSQ